MPKSVFDPVHWAMNVPPMLRKDGRPDETAHHVLLVLATFAKRDGSGARPSIATLTAKSYKVTEVAVVDALDRIEAARLISRTGDLNGTTVWALNMSVTRPEGDALEARRERARVANAERQRRFRDRSKAARNALPQRDVTVSDTVTEPSQVTVSQGVSNGVAPRESRRGKPLVTGSRPSQPQVSSGVTAIELPRNYQEDKDAGTSYRADADAPRGNGATEVVDAEFVDDDNPQPSVAPSEALFDVDDKSVHTAGKKPRKPKAEKPVDPETRQRLEQAHGLADVCYRARKQMVNFIAVKKIIARALANHPFEAVEAGVQRLSTVDRERPITLDTLRTAIERAAVPQQAWGQQQHDLPRLSTGDQRLVTGEWMKSAPNWDALRELGVTPENAHHFGYRPRQTA